MPVTTPELSRRSRSTARAALTTVRGALIAAAAATLALTTACSRRDATTVDHVAAADGRKLARITIQMDWYAQPEHGGFYQAQLTGLYDKAGLSVEIRQGGPNALCIERVVLGEVQFAITGLADVILARSRDLPLVAVAAYMQRDPQGILYHTESGVQSFADLDGRRIMAGTGAAWVEVIKRKAGIDFDILPLDFGMERFLQDKQFIQQCFVTSEPYYAIQNGAQVGTLLIGDSGFDPYRVIYCRRDFAEANPELVRKFVAATVAGWREYLFGNHTRTHQRLSALNPKMTPEFLDYSFEAILRHGLITGPGNDPAVIGRMTRERLAAVANDLLEVKLLSRVYTPEEFASLDYLPPP